VVPTSKSSNVCKVYISQVSVATHSKTGEIFCCILFDTFCSLSINEIKDMATTRSSAVASVSRPYRRGVKAIVTAYRKELVISLSNSAIADTYDVPSSHNSAYWLSKSSKVNDFHLIRKDLCDFLL